MEGSPERRIGLFGRQGRSRGRSTARRKPENAHVLFLSLFWRGGPDVDELRRLYQLANKVEFCAGTTIFSEGEHATTVYGLSKGYVRLYKNTRDGRRQIVAFALPGDFLGMPLAERHCCSADAIDQVVLCRFPRAEFANLIQTAPNMTRRLIDFATGELDRAFWLASLLGCSSAERRMTMFLVDWHSRLAQLGTPSQFVPLPMMRRDIADLLGLTPETVSRAFAKLQAKNFIRAAPKGVVLTGLEETLSK